MKRRASFLLALAFACAALAPAGARAKTTTRGPFAFVCSGNSTATLTVTFLGAKADRARLNFKGETVIAKQAMAASGARYVAKDIEFWNKGDDAIVEWRGEKLNCSTSK